MVSDFSRKDMTVTSIFGQHLRGKTVSQVEVLYMLKTTKYLPINVCKGFKNIKKIEAKPADLREISKEVFKYCTKMKSIYITSTLISSLPEDVFSELADLEILDLSYNRIEVLPKRLFEKNQKLKSIDFKLNLLRYISVELPSELTQAGFLTNLCINSNFPGSFVKLDMLVSEINDKCQGEKYIEVKEKMQKEVDSEKKKVQKLESKMKALADTEKNITKEVANCNALLKEKKDLNVALEASNTEFFKKIANLKIENAEKSEEIQLLTQNHTDLEESIEELFSNLTGIEQNRNEIATELDLKIQELENCFVKTLNITALFHLQDKMLETKLDETDKLKAKLNEMEKNSKETTNNLKVVNERLINTQNETDEMQNELNDYKEKTEYLELQVSDLELNLTSSYENCSIRYDDLEKVLNLTLSSLTQATQKLESITVEKEDLAENLMELKSIPESDIAECSQNILTGLLVFVTIGWIVTIIVQVMRRRTSSTNDKIQLNEYVE